jgi:L-histidine Nalpha-methyltransferase
VLVARRTALAVVPEKNCFPFVCDLATANDLPVTLARRSEAKTARLVTFFGMIPNFEPPLILPRLASLVRPKDFLLFSANLAPGTGYAAGVKKVLPQYDNPLTRDWLRTLLDNLGVGRGDGRMQFSIETGPLGLKRIEANFHFRRRCRIRADEEVFHFRAGEILRLFFSYRYTPERVRKALARHGLEISDQWIATSEEEGVFLCRRQ